MLLLAAGHEKFIQSIQLELQYSSFLSAKLFKNIQIHIIQLYSSTYYSSLSCAQK